jgi:hypothetical protein
VHADWYIATDASLPASFEQPYDEAMGRGVERGEPVDLSRISHECRAKWRTGAVGTWRQVQIAVGLLDDGRWYVERIGRIHGRPRVYSTKAAAWAVVRHLIAVEPDARWERVPCYPSEHLLKRPGAYRPPDTDRA